MRHTPKAFPPSSTLADPEHLPTSAGNDLLRLKGVLLTEGGRLVVQGVGGHIEISDPSERVSEGDGDGAAGANGTAASSSAPASSRLVLIGRVGEEALRRELKEGFEKGARL